MMRTVAVESCVALGFLALAMLGGPWFVASALAWGLALSARAVGPRLGGKGAWLMLVVGAVVLAAGGAGGLLTLEGAVVGGLVLLQLQRRLTRRGPTDDRVAVVIAGLMLVVTAGRNTDAAFFCLVVPWAACLPAALLPAGARTAPGAPHLVLGGVGHLLASLVVFVLLPRAASTPATTGDEKLVGFAPDVELGALDALLDDPTVVFRARAVGLLPERTYWRGLALDGFDGRRWYSSTPPVPATTQGAAGATHRVTIEPSGPSDGVLFAPGSVVHVEAEEVSADPQGGWFVPAARSREPYVLHVVLAEQGTWAPGPSGVLTQWLDLPAMDARVSQLASEVAGEGSDEVRARRLATWLASEVTYTRSSGDHGDAPLTSFLLDRREGHCEYVAGGLVVLLRANGIPARLVNGFVGGEVDPLTGDVVVRRQHAHSWTEALVDDRWVLLDATPSSGLATAAPLGTRFLDAADRFWQEEVVGYDRNAQQASLAWAVALARRSVARPALAVGILLVTGLLCWVGVMGLRRLWQARVPGAVASRTVGLVGPLQRAEQGLRDAGYDPPSSAPPVEMARWLRGRVPSAAADAFEALAWLHYDVVFGGTPASSVRPEARQLADRVLEQLDAPG